MSTEGPGVLGGLGHFLAQIYIEISQENDVVCE